MSSPNPLKLAMAAAEARHMANPAIAAIVGQLRHSRKMTEMHAAQPLTSPLAGYQRGAAGDDGYGLMHRIDASFFTRQLSEISELHAIAILTEVLVSALNAMGEEIEL